MASSDEFRVAKESSECRTLSENAREVRWFIEQNSNAFDLPETMTINAANLAH